MIYFFNTKKVNNYLTHPGEYQHMKGVGLISYYYWILKNAGKNVALANNLSEIKDDPNNYVIFHYDEASHINKLKRIKKCQWISDRPRVSGCVLYFVIDASLISSSNFFVHHPLPVKTVKCNPVFPPKIFSCVCHKQILSKEIQDRKTELEAKYNIQIRVQHMDWFNKGDEDVFFMVREPSNQPGHKPATRFFIAQAMGTPAIFSEQTAFKALGKKEYIVANNFKEFEAMIAKLVTDKEYFEKYIPKSKITVESINAEVVQQFEGIFKSKL